jgi:hypothetical protein
MESPTQRENVNRGDVAANVTAVMTSGRAVTTMTTKEDVIRAAVATAASPLG